jgi:hypothetical protein
VWRLSSSLARSRSSSFQHRPPPLLFSLRPVHRPHSSHRTSTTSILPLPFQPLEGVARSGEEEEAGVASSPPRRRCRSLSTQTQSGTSEVVRQRMRTSWAPPYEAKPAEEAGVQRLITGSELLRGVVRRDPDEEAVEGADQASVVGEVEEGEEVRRLEGQATFSLSPSSSSRLGCSSKKERSRFLSRIRTSPSQVCLTSCILF